MYVTHDRVHCHWRWQCHYPLFASFANWINASLPNNAMVWLQGMSHLMRGDLFPFWKFEQQGTCNFFSWSWGSFGRIWHELIDVWAIIWLWWDRTCRICGHRCELIAVKSVVDMLKMWVHKRTKAENNPTNHYQSKVWYLAMVTQTIKCNFGTLCLITRHSSIWITNDCIHCSLPSQLTKLAKSGIKNYDIVIFNGNVLGHAWHIWCKNGTNGKKMSCSLHTGHIQILKWIDFRTMGLWIWITFFYTHCIKVE